MFIGIDNAKSKFYFDKENFYFINLWYFIT